MPNAYVRISLLQNLTIYSPETQLDDIQFLFSRRPTHGA